MGGAASFLAVVGVVSILDVVGVASFRAVAMEKKTE